MGIWPWSCAALRTLNQFTSMRICKLDAAAGTNHMLMMIDQLKYIRGYQNNKTCWGVGWNHCWCGGPELGGTLIFSFFCCKTSTGLWSDVRKKVPVIKILFQTSRLRNVPPRTSIRIRWRWNYRSETKKGCQDGKKQRFCRENNLFGISS